MVFVGVLVLSPERGLIAKALRRERQRLEFVETMLAIHILNHEGTDRAIEENRVDGLEEHLRWQPSFTERIVSLAKRQGLRRRIRRPPPPHRRRPNPGEGSDGTGG